MYARVRLAHQTRECDLVRDVGVDRLDAARNRSRDVARCTAMRAHVVPGIAQCAQNDRTDEATRSRQRDLHDADSSMKRSSSCDAIARGW